MWHPNVMNRVGFTKVARQLGCQLYIPFPGEQVAVLKTGLLLHIEAYMQVRVLLALCIQAPCLACCTMAGACGHLIAGALLPQSAGDTAPSAACGRVVCTRAGSLGCLVCTTCLCLVLSMIAPHMWQPAPSLSFALICTPGCALACAE